MKAISKHIARSAFITLMTLCMLSKVTAQECNMELSYDFLVDSCQNDDCIASIRYEALNLPEHEIDLFCWNFGDGTSTCTDTPFFTHTYTRAGAYQIFLVALSVDNEDCEAFVGVPVFDNHDSCGITQNIQASTSAALASFSSSNPNIPEGAFYDWSFGNGETLTGTQSPMVSTSYSEEGNYEVCVTAYQNDPDLIFCQECTQVEISADMIENPVMIQPMLSIEGEVHSSTTCEVQLFRKHDGTEWAYQQSLMTNQDNKEFRFQQLDTAIYIIRTIPAISQDKKEMLTYYPERSSWADAYQLTLNHSIKDIDISLNKGVQFSPNQNGKISGWLQAQILNDTSFNIDLATMTLSSQSGVMIDFDSISETGFFEFNNLSLGYYKLLLDMPSYRTASLSVQLTRENPSQQNLLMTPDELDGTSSRQTSFPNFIFSYDKGSNKLHLEWKEQNLAPKSIQFYRFDGTLYQSIPIETTNSYTTINLANFHDDLYLWVLTGKQSEFLFKRKLLKNINQ